MVTISNAHEGLIHDAVLDYYGKRLATCSSDKTIKIFEVDGDDYKLVETLKGHEGPVWQLSWAHPKFGVVLASCSYDGKVLIWKEEKGIWKNIAEHSVHQASVNSISWAPSEYGALLLCTSSDGQCSVVEFEADGNQKTVVWRADAVGVNAGTWAPPQRDNAKEKRVVTGGCDNLVKIWRFDTQKNTYVQEEELKGHTDWVRDVAWSQCLLSKFYIASASQDRTVIIWTKDVANANATWRKQLLRSDKFPDVCWRVSWSMSGNVLAVSGGDNKVTLWKENLNGDWEQVGEVDQ
ncbi:GTPase-activating protein S13 [Brettanomyces bruxellensis]|uniref:DEBR0S4_00914g1_1 n=1 Tax=Dekkera bruxellensis TaxID=5007 RepID=A0A7D9H3H5_DEKBR|nr:GTPase-activating protein S13 [Brettanomyces bruxellensis]EIF46429.1 protein transport protein sec13 [Brettanomyces bruxellensis AWRI1499]KAF6007935.1 GTPase-activating protein S13 [Brettanomyces bruxellensis]KAF6012883.1 GTPase-activating protein S13 [Brettanomyces bruxellensis]QOU18249.1 GTPase-activating protein S13 [Brettanomyces bruxellensis]VUG18729.1 SEC13 [Brettanomyces bruxellensis]